MVTYVLDSLVDVDNGKAVAVVMKRTPLMFAALFELYTKCIPFTVQVGCRIRCHYCPQDLLLTNYFEGFSRRENILSLEAFKKCIDKIPKDCIVTFSGYCEPFQHPDIVEMIKYADKKGLAIQLYTTFDGCTIKQFEAIKEVNFSKVVLHEPDEDGHAHINCNEEYWSVIDRVLDWKRSDGRMMCDRANGQSAPSREFVEKTNRRITIKTNLNNRAGYLNNDGDKLRSKCLPNGKIYCSKSLFQNQWVLLPDGTVTLCCNDFGLRHVIGNLLESSYDELLQSDEYKRVKRQMLELEDSKDLLCRECYYANQL
ncbi:MAG: SPASM domain-containing protein [Eubacterium sp.]|nr:SPASM domain-containing protein [Eubacterium sp.]